MNSADERLFSNGFTSGMVSLVIPTLNASWELPGLLERVERQTLCPGEILVIDSSSDDNTVDIALAHERVRVEIIDRAEFNHGLTRHRALLSTSGDFVCFMTQDAIPADNYYFEALLAPLLDAQIALVSGRQLPRPDARPFEKLVREFNYDDKSNVRSAEDVPIHGIKTFFASDVCSVYRRSAYLECGGFVKLNMSEDMYMAAKLISAGYKVAYAADACVYHSHNFTPTEQYYRNKAIGSFIELHREELCGVEETNEGLRLVKDVAYQLLKQGNIPELAAFGLDCIARVAGNRAGRGSVRRLQLKEALS